MIITVSDGPPARQTGGLPLARERKAVFPPPLRRRESEGNADSRDNERDRNSAPTNEPLRRQFRDSRGGPGGEIVWVRREYSRRDDTEYIAGTLGFSTPILRAKVSERETRIDYD